MEQLKRSECGIYADDRAIEIGEDFEKILIPLLRKWDNIDSLDIENIIYHTLPYLMAKRTLRRASDIMTVKGYKNSHEMKIR